MNAGGNAVVSWTQSCAAWANTYVAGTGWATAVTLGGSAPCAALQTPPVVIDGSGNAIVAWTLSTGASSQTWIDRYSPGAGWAGALSIMSGITDFQVALDASGDTIDARRQGASILANDSFVVAEAWSTGVVVFPAAESPTLSMDGNGNVVMLVKVAEATGRNTLWASIFK
jgi:hypothetical protein